MHVGEQPAPPSRQTNSRTLCVVICELTCEAYASFYMSRVRRQLEAVFQTHQINKNGHLSTVRWVKKNRSAPKHTTFLWVPSHAGCASNAYADAAATAYMGASEIEDATAVIREAVRTRPCLYTDRRRTADREGGREVLDRRTYYATRGHTNEWVREDGSARGSRRGRTRQG